MREDDFDEEQVAGAAKTATAIASVATEAITTPTPSDNDSTDAARATTAFDTADDMLELAGTIAQGDITQLGLSQLGVLSYATEGLGEIAGWAGDDQFKDAMKDVGSHLADAKRVTKSIAAGFEAIRDLVATLGPRVTYSLTTTRSIEGVLDLSDWQVQSVRTDEAISECYEVILRIATSHKDSDPTVLVGADATLLMERDSLSNTLRGIIRRVEQAQVTDEVASYEVHVVPAFALMAQRVDSRIFQNLTVPEILLEVLGVQLQSLGRCVDFALEHSYLKREYCVQYQESDLDFCCRLMEEEGIAYYFTHRGDHERLVLVDGKANYPKIETRDRLSIPISTEGMTGVESVQTFTQMTQLTPTSVLVSDYEWTAVRGLRGEAQSVDPHGRTREVYDHATELTITDYKYGLVYTKEDSTKQAQIRLLEQTRDRQTCSGLGFVLQMKPGMTFELTGHSNPDLNATYLLTKVRHVNAAPPGASEDPNARQLGYHNVFECIPLARFVPARRRKKPRIYGAQSAWVMGPEVDRVHTDEWGRVRLHFPWDRWGYEEPENQRTCWVRVQQTLSGPGWGTVFIPHVGMEAIVTFLNGDPDRPVVTGTVYNGENLLPYPLPDRNTISTIRTVGNNELRFNDIGGGEEIYLHAQKNLNEKVENDHSTTVNGQHTETIKGDQRITVTKGNRIIKVSSGNQEEEIQGDRSTIIHGKRSETIDQTEDITVTGARTLTAKAGNAITVTGQHSVTASQVITLDAGEKIVFRVNGSAVEITESGIVLVAQDGASIRLDADILLSSSDQTSSLSLTGNAAEMINSAGAIAISGGNIGLSAQDGATVAMDASLHAQSGSSNLELKSNSISLAAGVATLDLAYAKATMNSAETTIKSGENLCKADPAGVTILGTMVNIN